MNRSLTLLFLCACLSCWLIGCRDNVDKPAPNAAPQANATNAPAPKPEPEPNPKPEPKPEPVVEPTLDSRFADWLQQSPMRLKMRSMWVSAGMISANTGGYQNTDFDVLESNAENIARKAGEFASMWETIRDANRLMATKAKSDEWFDARIQSQRLWKSCNDCHVETWSMETRGFVPDSIEGWLKKGNAAERVPFSGLNLTAPPEYLRIMFTSVALLERSIGAIDGRNSTEVLENTKQMHEIVNDQLEMWQAVERYARNIVEIAAKTDAGGIEEQYPKLVKACTTCHDKFVKDERVPLNPLPWKHRVR